VFAVGGTTETGEAGVMPTPPAGERAAAVGRMTIFTAVVVALGLVLQWRLSAGDGQASGDTSLAAGIFVFSGVLAAWFAAVCRLALMLRRRIGLLHLWILLVFPVGSVPLQMLGGTPLWVALLLLVLGVAFGALAWLVIAMPVVVVIRDVPLVVRGESSPSVLLVPVGWLALAGLIGLLPVGVDFDHPGPAAWGAVVASLLGIPGEYEVTSGAALWIARLLLALVLGIVVAGVASARRRARRRRAET
jgi:hypothetical protein